MLEVFATLCVLSMGLALVFAVVVALAAVFCYIVATIEEAQR